MKQKFAVIFDMDGVIVDSNPVHKEAWFKFCERHNVELKEEDVPKYIYGKTNRQALRDVFKKEFSREESDRLGEEKEAIYRELHRDTIEPIPGLPQYLQLLKQHEILTAVATNAPTANLDFILDAVNVRQYFDVTIDATQVNKGKPDPEIYLKAAELLNMPPERCIVMEDSTTGAEAGLRAGMKVITITTTHTRDELAHTHLVIDKYDELTMEKLEALIK